MSKKYAILFCWLFICVLINKANGQQIDPDTTDMSAGNYISGILVDKETKDRLSDVNITNLQTNKKARSNHHGIFFIEASPGDSLSFTKVGFGAVKTRVSSRDDILIEMQAGLEIETVIVSGKSREAEMRDMLKDYEKKGVFNGGKNKVGTYLNSPATALYNLFGREAKNAKRFQKYMDREQEEIQVDRVFSKAKVQKETQLEDKDLEDFMDLYRPSYRMVSTWGEYDLVAYINRSFRQWEKEGRPRPEPLPKLDIPPQEK
ncbi:MAG TPA: hypothetical protein VK102_01900 [Sphingobacterium sp.]|nr:hypothetical protein [Sphingobacterium sp.]